ncbi:MAG: hypothetical protein WD042_11545 [Phycisphaeraceae bacterium]
MTQATLASPRMRIALTLDGGGVARRRWPITQGVPVPDGVLAPGAPVRVVTEDGTPLPTQAICLATWRPDCRFAKWLLVDFQADVPVSPQTVWLELDAPQPPPPPEHAVAVHHLDGDARLRINTGTMELELRSDCPDVFSNCRVQTPNGWSNMWPEAMRPTLYVSDQNHTRYQSPSPGILPKMAIEDAGPLRACLRISGIHACGDDRMLCPFILRLHLHAGRSELRLFHTFIFDGDPERTGVTEIGMTWPVDSGSHEWCGFGGHTQPHLLSGDGEATLLHDSDRTYCLAQSSHLTRYNGRAPGWAALVGTRSTLVAVMRDMPLMYPKALRLAERCLDLQFWPGGNQEHLTFQTPFREEAIFFNGTRSEAEFRRLVESRPTAPLNLKSLFVRSEAELMWVELMLKQYAPHRPASYNDTGTATGYGAARTHECLLQLSTHPMSPDDADHLAACVNSPVTALPLASHITTSGAVRHAYPSDDPEFAAVDRGLDDLIHTVVVEPRERCRRYGMWMHGSLMASHATGPGYCYRFHKDRDPLTVNRFVGPYNNESNDQVWNLWMYAIHTGHRDDLLLAASASSQMADAAIIHVGPDAGLMHYHNAHLWSGPPSPSHTLTCGLLLHYYLTGDRRLLEVALESADWALRTSELAGIISNRGYALHREYTAPLICLLEAYQATWDDRYGDIALQSLNWLLDTAPRPGLLPISVFTCGERGDEAIVQPSDRPCCHYATVYPLYYDALRLWNHDGVRQTVIAEADHMVWRQPVHHYHTRDTLAQAVPDLPDVQVFPIDDTWYWTNWPRPDVQNAAIVAIAYELTKDPIYAAWAKYLLEHYFLDLTVRVAQLAPISFSFVELGQPIPALMWLVHQAMASSLDLLRDAEHRWRYGRAVRGWPVYDGPHDWLPRDALHFDAAGYVIGQQPVTDIPRAAGIGRPELPKRSLGVIPVHRAYRSR